MPDEKDPGILAWLWEPSAGLKIILLIICAIGNACSIVALGLLLFGCSHVSVGHWETGMCDADGDCGVVTVGGHSIDEHHLDNPEGPLDTAGSADLTWHFNAPWGHKLPGEK